MRVPSDRLYVRLDVARAAFANAVNPQFRLTAMQEIDALKAEIVRRGLPPVEAR
jgi:hypothetical protein